MVVRTWSGETKSDNAGRYVDHLRRSVVPELKRIRGFKGIYVLRRATADGHAFQVLTLWDSIDAVRAFAGGAPDAAVVADEARAVLSRFDEVVQHFEVVIAPEPSR